MNERQNKFCLEYLVDFNGTQAAIRAGYSPNGAGQAAFMLLANNEIAQRVEELQDEALSKTMLTQAWVLNQWRMIATADPNELISVKLECCRHCYGKKHQYQWDEFTHGEAQRIAFAHRCSKLCEPPCFAAIPPATPGGFGFDPNLPPASYCPACHGEGNERILVADTRRLTGSARRLYAGVKKTKDGIEVKMRDQDGALSNIAKYLGMIIEKRQLSGPDGGPIPIAAYRAEDLTDDQLAQIVAQRNQSMLT